jgi:hypothetical protein
MLNIVKFKKICSYSKKFLNKFQDSKFIFSINILHIIRPHPVFLQNYEIVFEKNFYLKIIFIFIKNLLRLIGSVFRTIFTRKYNYKNIKKYKYVFFSHLFNESEIKSKIEEDVYFSHICSNLNKSDYCIIYLNHLRKNYKSENNKIYLNLSLSFCEEFYIFLKLINSSVKILIKSINEKDSLYKKFCYFAFVNCLSVSTLSNLRIFYQSKEIIKKINPKKVTVTYEGHAFERNIFRAINCINKDIQKVAFHHSIPFKNQFSYTLNFKNGSNPDYILTSGKLSHKKLKKIIKIKKNKILLIGSNRISLKKKLRTKKIKNKINCLVLPEGIESETEYLLNFCKNYTNRFHNITFTIRLHPILKYKFNYYKKSYSTNFQNEKKIVFSIFQKASQDFIRNEVCLYRGTSLIFDAMKYGLLPYYLTKKNEISFDPVSIEKNNFNKINNVAKLNDFMKNYKNNRKLKFQNPYSLPNKKLIKFFYL